MPRPPRNFAEGLYHLAAHASDTRQLFLSDDDRRSFLERLAHSAQRFELGIVAYVLMGNHYHVIARIPDARVSRALQLLHTSYSRHHNHVHGRSAHLFRAHCMAREVKSDDDLLSTCRYLALNPVNAKLVSSALEWPWSSAQASAGTRRSPLPLEEGPLRAAFDDSSDWRRHYRNLIESADDGDRL